MPLFQKSKICFIHIPKCGGTTFTTAMRSKLKDIVSFYNNSFKPSSNKEHSPQHSTYLELKNIIPDDYRVIASIRDPYERFLSEYRWRIKGGMVKKDISQIDFAKSLFLSDRWWDNHDKSQSYFISGGEAIIELIKINEMDVFFKKNFNITIDIKNATNSKSYEISK